MTILLIVLLVLMWITEIALVVITFKGINATKSPPPAKIDVNLTDLNTFIRKEFLFEFIKWIMPAPTTIEMNGPVKMPSFINDLKKPEVLKEKMTLITIQIISKMSVYLINEFNAVYKNLRSGDKETQNLSLYNYIARQVMFYLRRVDFEITTLFETDTKSKPTDILKQYVLAIETEIYKLNNILIVGDRAEESMNESENVKG